MPDRKEIIRIDCPTCDGNGYVEKNGEQEACDRCGGVGMLEKSMPWRPEGYTLDDASRVFGVAHATNRLLPGDPGLERRPTGREEAE